MALGHAGTCVRARDSRIGSVAREGSGICAILRGVRRSRVPAFRVLAGGTPCWTIAAAISQALRDGARPGELRNLPLAFHLYVRELPRF